MSKIITCSVFPSGKSIGLLANKSPTFIIPSRGKRIPSHKKRFAGDGDLSQTDPGKLTDIRYYQALEKSHLHKWEGKSPKRKFELKLEEMEKKKYFTNEGISSRLSETKKDSDQKMVESANSHSDSAQNSDPIIIPTYIERSPSTILRVLASCVGRDNTAPDYKYHDDPFLIPYNSIQKRDYILAKDSGRKAARYVLENHPELFANNLIYDEPKISKYLPKLNAKGKEKNIGFLKELLEQNISSFDVLGAIETYELLAKTPTGIEKLNENTIVDLLELLCYNNNEEETDSENYPLLAGLYPDQKGKHWVADGLAEKLYSEVINNPRFENNAKDRARLALLCARGKFKGGDNSSLKGEGNSSLKGNLTDRVLQLKDECTASGTNLNLEAYNAVLFGMSSRHRNFETGKTKLIEILEEMSRNGVDPDEQTLYNAMRYVYNLVSSTRESNAFIDAQKTAQSLFSEFRNLGIEPTLGAFEYLMKIYNKSVGSGKSHAIIFDIIGELEKKQKSGISLKLIIPEDADFFHQAMYNIFNIKNVKLAYRTHRLLLNEGENSNVLLGGYLNQTYYYKNLMMTAIHNDSLDVAMELYSTLIPNVYSPHLDLYRSLLEEISVQVGHKHIPRLWTDLQASGFCGAGLKAKMPLSETFVSTMAGADLTVFSECTDSENEEKRNLLKAFTLIGKEMFEEIRFISERRSKVLPLSQNLHAAGILSKTMDLAIKQIEIDEVADFSLVVDIMNFTQENITSLNGTLDSEVLLRIVQTVTSLPLTGGKALGLQCVHYAAENRCEEALEMANMVVKHFTNLEKAEMAQLNQLFAHQTEWTNLE